MKGSQIRLFIGTPCYGGVVTTRYMQSICALLCQNIQNLNVSIKTIAYDFLGDAGAKHDRGGLSRPARRNPSDVH